MSAKTDLLMETARAYVHADRLCAASMIARADGTPAPEHAAHLDDATLAFLSAAYAFVDAEEPKKPITVSELARHRGVKPDDDGCVDATEYDRVGLPMMGGCVGCEATIAAYNAHPSKCGFLKCGDCIGDDGWTSVEECDRDLFGTDTVAVLEPTGDIESVVRS